jgi:hypothetical protein
VVFRGIASEQTIKKFPFMPNQIRRPSLYKFLPWSRFEKQI